MKATVVAASLAVILCCAQAQDLDGVRGLTCPSAGYMSPDSANLCFVWFCERPGEAPIKRMCPKGVRVPTWWTGGELAMCNIVNIEKHGGEPVCLRCAADDVQVVDSCAETEYPCAPECTCVDIEHTHRCDCPVELGVIGGGSVPAPRDHCQPNQCENGASCQNQWDGFFCFCPNGWTGHRCETSVCDWHPCLNGGTCVIDEIGYHCECTECWGGSCCNVTLHGCAVTEQPAVQKPCGPCQEGLNCEIPKDICGCAQDPCSSGYGTCVDTPTGPECQDCDECFTGKECKTRKDTCKCNGNCPSNARCEDLSDIVSHECICNKCWRGDQCDLPIVSCECNSPCDEEQQCTTVNGQPSCGCTDPCRTGAQCDQVVNSCACNNPCLNGGQCSDSDSGPVCSCDACYAGDYCETPVINCQCANNCAAGEACYDVSSGVTSCGCSGPCKTGPGCVDTVNSCECANPCTDDQVCSKTGEELSCSCANPCRTGSRCENTISSCACDNPCQNGGLCSEQNGALSCSQCDACWAGDYCQDRVVSCDCNSPCGTGEVCNMQNGAPVCGCPDCMTGDYCDIPVDSCTCNNPCNDKSTCQDIGGSAQCVCDCTGNEVCRNDSVTNQPICKCPLCFFNNEGESGCANPVTNLCVCDNPCTADQQVCVDGPTGSQPICKIGNPSSGNAFTVVFEENDSEKSFREIPLELYMTPAVPDSGPRSVNIRSAGLPSDHHCYFNVNATIPENDVYRYPVERCMMHNKTGLENLAIRLTELNNDTMLVYGINKDRWTADGFLATPDFQAGSSFQTVSYAPAHISTQFAIVALFDDTDVEIELADDNDLPHPYNVKGAIYKITMQAFQTFQVQARCPNAPKGKKRQCEKDLSGSIVTANNKIHVFSGNVRAFVKAGEGLSRDHLVEELVPTDRWGKEFGFISIPGRAVGDLLNIMAKKGEATNVDIYYGTEKNSYSLPKDGRLNTYVEVPSNTRFFIRSNKPLSVTQLTKSKDTYLYQNETVHDPVTITIPPTAQFTNNFFISTPLFSGGENFQLKPYQMNLALLVARKGKERYITLNGNSLSEFVMPWGDMPMADGGSEALVGAVIEIPHGTQIIRNTEGHNFQCIVYGYDDRESYGFPAAMNHAVVV